MSLGLHLLQSCSCTLSLCRRADLLGLLFLLLSHCVPSMGRNVCYGIHTHWAFVPSIVCFLCRPNVCQPEVTSGRFSWVVTPCSKAQCRTILGTRGSPLGATGLRMSHWAGLPSSELYCGSGVSTLHFVSSPAAPLHHGPCSDRTHLSVCLPSPTQALFLVHLLCVFSWNRLFGELG